MQAREPSSNSHRNSTLSPNTTVNPGSISIDPGQDFVEWKQKTQSLLKQRERNLMKVRCDAAKSIINEAIQIFAVSNGLSIDSSWDFNDNDHDITLQQLYKVIDSWNGVQITRLKSNKMDSFKKYFVIGKNWYDQNKKKVWAPYFWLKILLQNNKFAKNTGEKLYRKKCILLQKELSHCLELEILSAIVDGKVQFAQTKQQPLIPNGTLKQSILLKNYLLDFDPSLSISKWCDIQTNRQEEADAVHNKKRKRTGDAKLLVEQLKDTLSILLSVSHDNMCNTQRYCQDIVRCVHHSIDKTKDIKTITIQKAPTEAPLPIYQQQSTYVESANAAYKPSYCSSQAVSEIRYSPIHNASLPLYNNVNAPFTSTGCCCENCQYASNYAPILNVTSPLNCCQCNECYIYTNRNRNNNQHRVSSANNNYHGDNTCNYAYSATYNNASNYMYNTASSNDIYAHASYNTRFQQTPF